MILGGGATADTTLEVVVVDTKGEPVKDAVVYAVDRAGHEAPPPMLIDIDQVDKEFVPYVTAVRVGTAIRFPNRDQIRHHVYSFSKAKSFEIPLYQGIPADPVVFDEPGVVVMGCNIHDWMRAYVFITETPYFAVTDQKGRAVLRGLSAREYEVSAWHPQVEGEVAAKPVTGGSVSELDFVIKKKKEWKPRRGPNSGPSDYR